MKKIHDNRYHKVANIIGNTMQYHPHGDQAIGDALVALGQKDSAFHFSRKPSDSLVETKLLVKLAQGWMHLRFCSTNLFMPQLATRVGRARH